LLSLEVLWGAITGGVNGLQAYGINDRGYIVGAYQDSANNTNGFIWNGSSYIT
jgi:probable HAF family extracellular repeat protein